MINTQMREYDYYTYGEMNAYGQPQLSDEPKGKVKMAINLVSQAIGDNVLYADAQYTGLTFDAIDDTYVIQYGDEKIKVLSVYNSNRYNHAFMKRM